MLILSILPLFALLYRIRALELDSGNRVLWREAETVIYIAQDERAAIIDQIELYERRSCSLP